MHLITSPGQQSPPLELEDFQPPPDRPADRAELFTGDDRLRVQTPAESHETKKRSGSSDGAQTYDTPIT